MQKVLTAEEMREVDRLTTEKYGIPSLLLMENAAHAAVRVITEKLGGTIAGKSFLILCGKGNNGGDGAAMARILSVNGAFVETVLFGKVAETKGDAKINFEICQKLSSELTATESRHPDVFALGFSTFYECDSGGKWNELLDNKLVQTWDCVIDAIFGTGLIRQLDSFIENVVSGINIINDVQKDAQERFSVSVDLPSGLNADLSQSIGTAFQADLTVTFTAPKSSNVLPPASRLNGELVCVNIGSPQELIDNSPSQLFVAEQSDAQNWLWQTRFTAGSYKNKRGHALLIAGSKNYTGAAVMAGGAAAKTGVGLVTVATPESAKDAVAARLLPEVITNAVAELANGAMSDAAFEELEKLFDKIDALAIGCGLDASDERTKMLVRKIVKNRRAPVVVDADGLNALSPFDLQGSNELPIILTPHEGEMRRLLGVDKNFDFSDRVKIARDFAQKHHIILLLKGERSLIAAPDGRVVVNPTGNAGIGKGGSGDTLTGIITGFVAQSFAAPNAKAGQINAAFEAVIAALYISGLAGDIAARKFGMRSITASDIRDCLGDAFRELEDDK